VGGYGSRYHSHEMRGPSRSLASVWLLCGASAHASPPPEAPAGAQPNAPVEPTPVSPATTIRPEVACTGGALAYERPAAVFQVSPWLHAGGGWRSDDRGATALFSAGGGVDGTFAVATLFRSPEDDNGGPFQLRAGPWMGLESPLDRLRGEGGLSLTLKQTRVAWWGTLGLRLGGGYSTREVPNVVGVLSWGVWGEPQVYSYWDGPWCSVPPGPPNPPEVGFASGVRFFVSFRRELHSLPASEVAFGVEFEPTWFLPPYSYQKWRRH
jgi:hypothetical protein